MKDFLVLLRTIAWRTAGARYNAARRLKRRELFSVVSLAMFSALSVGVAVVQRIYSPHSGTPLDNYLTALSVCLGVFLLAISLMEWGAANGARADALHRNAEDLTAFQIKLSQESAQLAAGSPVTWAHIELLRTEYETIKDRCSHNHDPRDEQLFRTAHRSAPEFARADGTPAMNKGEAFLVALRWHVSSVWYFALFWAAIVGSLSFAFCLRP